MHRLQQFRSTRSAPNTTALEWRQYYICLAQNKNDRDRAFALRHQIFHDEMDCTSQLSNTGIERDSFDDFFEQVLIIDRNDNSLLGTCRIALNKPIEQSYSATEFYLNDFFKSEGNKIELGRVCLSLRGRNTMTLIALWRFLGYYFQKHNARYLFGCTSINTEKPEELIKLLTWLQQNDRLLSSNVCPQSNHFQDFPEELADYARHHHVTEREIGEFLPPLMRSYVRAGAQFSTTPILDHDFHCADLFTVFDIHENMTLPFIARYWGDFYNNKVAS